MTNKLLIVLALFCSACTATRTPVPQKTEYIEIFMQRPSSYAVEFEQYKISPGGIFVECGELYRGKLQPKSQKFIAATDIALDEVMEKAGAVQRTASPDALKSLPAPDKGNSLFNAGQFIATIGDGDGAVSVQTTVNDVVNEMSPLAMALKKLAVSIRGVLKTEDCGKENFYGIPGSA